MKTRFCEPLFRTMKIKFSESFYLAKINKLKNKMTFHPHLGCISCIYDEYIKI